MWSMRMRHNGKQSWLRENLEPENHWQRGMVTAELATAMPAVATLLLVVMALVAVSGAQFRASDTVRTAARMAATGVPPDQVRYTVSQRSGIRPEDISIAGDEQGLLTVSVHQRLRVGPIWLGPIAVNSTATTWLEPCLTPLNCPIS